MAKSKKRSRRKQSTSFLERSLPRAARDRLCLAMELSDEGRQTEAREILERLNCRYPDRIDIVGELYNRCAEIHDLRGIERVAARLIRLHPHDPGVILALADAYVFTGRMVLATRTFRRFIESWPSHDEADYVRRTLPIVESIAKQRTEEAGFTGADAFEMAEMHEESLALMDQGDYRAARAMIDRILDLHPNLDSADNILSLIAMCENKLGEAMEIAERVLRRDERNVQALANMIRFLVIRGEPDKARLYADRLKAIDLPLPEVWIKKAEAFSFLGDDSGVLEVLSEIEKEEVFSLPAAAGLVFHYGAVSILRTGAGGRTAVKKAKSLWEQALELCAGLELAESNLEDLRKPIGERHGPWPFHLQDWVRREVVYQLDDQLEEVSENDLSTLVTAGRKFLARYPELTEIVPHLLERGDPAGRSFAIRVASIGQTPELLSALRDFVFSRYGPDLIRIRATEVLLQTDWLQSGSHQMWVKGRREESLVMGAVIDGEPIRNVGEEASPLSDEALHALRAGDGLKAEGLLRQALLIEPDNPMLINNLLSSLSLQGRTEEVEELAEKLHRQFPDYFFGCINMAMLAIQKGELDRAREYLKPLYSRRHFHYSEYRSFASVQIELALARRDRKTARQWFENWERIDPDNEERERFRLLL